VGEEGREEKRKNSCQTQKKLDLVQLVGEEAGLYPLRKKINGKQHNI